MQIITIDGACMTDRRTAHLYLACTLRFPVYYGRNLDALYDCLTEFGGDLILRLRHADALKEHLGAYGEGMLTVFSDAAAQSGLRFFVDPE